MIKQKTNKQAFTLVELIVVITILAILWTIAFISLQWYSKDARNSVRVSDMSRLKTSLELFQLDAWKYPITSDWVKITFSWSEVWTQWEFWIDTFNNVEKLDKIPTDPLTDRKYVYSTTNTRQEYQLAWISEWEGLALSNWLLNQSLAWNKIATLNIKWNYNWKLTKVSTWGIDYILALPSLISSTWATTLESIVSNDMLAYDGYKNLPLQYINSSYNPLGESSTLSLVNNNDYVVYSWAISLLSKSENQDLRRTLIENLQNAYTWTAIKNEWQIQSILLTDTTDTSATEILSSSIVTYNLGWSIISSSGPVVVEEEVNTTPAIISLLWTNSLTTTNYTASSIYVNEPQDWSYWAPWAFDWYRFQAGTAFLSWVWARHWEWSWTSLANSNTNQWIQVAFNQARVITQFSVYPKAAYPYRMPKDIKIQYSGDWVTFTDHESFTLIQWDNLDIDLATPTPSSNYIRLFIINNHTGDQYLQIDELILTGY
jgi:prepilin-type N-terminal cleavage/methylation domain-containing protein